MAYSKLFKKEKHEKADANSWEKTFGKIKTPFEVFVNSSTGSGLLLIFLTVIALIIANTGWNEFYKNIIGQHFSLQLGDFKFDLSLHHWVNDALMAIFFYLVGLEIKYEILVGELSSVKKAILPIMAAIGGMIVPAVIYFVLNHNTDAVKGWGVPMATDIAFAMAVLLLLGNKVPKSLMTILVALAIVDDLGAVVIIALFYSDGIVWSYLFMALACFLLMLVLGYAGMRSLPIFFIFALILWFLMHESGVHATIAGVLSAFATPVKSIYKPDEFSNDARKLLDYFDEKRKKNNNNLLSSDQLSCMLHNLSVGVNKTQTPLQIMEHKLHFPVHFLIIPLFVLFNAGVHVDFNSISQTLTSWVTLGVAFGLVLGKFIGVLTAVFLCVKFKLAQLPSQVNFLHIAGVALLAGIGFTMSIFIAELAFDNHAYLTNAKIAILLASIFSGFAGYLWLRIVGKGKVYD